MVGGADRAVATDRIIRQVPASPVRQRSVRWCRALRCRRALDGTGRRRSRHIDRYLLPRSAARRRSSLAVTPRHSKTTEATRLPRATTPRPGPSCPAFGHRRPRLPQYPHLETKPDAAADEGAEAGWLAYRPSASRSVLPGG